MDIRRWLVVLFTLFVQVSVALVTDLILHRTIQDFAWTYAWTCGGLVVFVLLCATGHDFWNRKSVRR